MGELIVVAATPGFEETQAFYVGEILEPTDTTTGQFTFQFYNNITQELYGKYAPAWLDLKFNPSKEDYGPSEAKTDTRYTILTSWGLLEWLLCRNVKLMPRTKKLPPALENSLKELLSAIE